jgi:pyruvate/2-oxoglutarate dehydrogenase complex dihydrolipoamide dehydrogenase (E3) component
MERNGIVFHCKERAQSCTASAPESAAEPDRVSLTLGSGKLLTVDAVLVAAGRKSTVEGLNLPAAGVAAGDRGSSVSTSTAARTSSISTPRVMS